MQVEVVRKDIRHIHLRVHSPAGRVTISAPLRTSLETIHGFALSKLGWIERQRKRMQGQVYEAPREYVNDEPHRVWGQVFHLTVVEGSQAVSVQICDGRIILRVWPETGTAVRRMIMEEWYRALVLRAAPPLLEKWERTIGVQVAHFNVRRMKSRWGSCNPRKRRIHLSLELAKKPRECLEYVLVHEILHLLEPGHGRRFKALLDQYMPDWRTWRALLMNRGEVAGRDAPATGVRGV